MSGKTCLQRSCADGKVYVARPMISAFKALSRPISKWSAFKIAKDCSESPFRMYSIIFLRFSFVNPVGGRWFQAAPGGVSGAVFQ